MRIEAGTARRQGFKMPILCGPATQPENALHLGNQAQCSVLPPTERFDRLPLQLLPTLPAPPHRAAGRARRFRTLLGRLLLALVPAHASQDACVLRTAFADQPTSSPPITPCNAVCRTGDSRFWKSDSGRQSAKGSADWRCSWHSHAYTTHTIIGSHLRRPPRSGTISISQRCLPGFPPMLMTTVSPCSSPRTRSMSPLDQSRQAVCHNN